MYDMVVIDPWPRVSIYLCPRFDWDLIIHPWHSDRVWLRWLLLGIYPVMVITRVISCAGSLCENLMWECVKHGHHGINRSESRWIPTCNANICCIPPTRSIVRLPMEGELPLRDSRQRVVRYLGMTASRLRMVCGNVGSTPCETTGARYMTWYIWPEIYDLRCMTWDIWPEICDLRYMTWDIWPEIYDLRYMTWDIWPEIYDLI